MARVGHCPTVSDAYLLCGYLSADAPLAGGLRLRRDLADAAMQPIAAALGCDATQAAESCIAVASANMLANALPFIARLGVSPAELTLMIFGGAGAVHGPLLAEEMGIGRVVVPRVSSVFCAFGCLVSDLLYDAVQTVHGTTLAPADIAARFSQLRAEGTAWLAEQSAGLAPEFDYYADIRYAGQSFDVATRLDAAAAETGDLDRVADAFHAEHRHLFGHSRPGAPIEIISLRIRVRGSLPRPDAASSAKAAGNDTPARRRRARFEGKWHDTPIHDWMSLPPGWKARGPVLIEQETATVVIPPTFSVALGQLGDLILERN